MRFIDRNSIQPPMVLTDPEGLAADEKARAVDHYNVPASQVESFKFTVYKHATVKTALEQLFHKKCAYCESRYAVVSPPDIEHFRPKSAVVRNGQLTKPGYYWLAAEWSNLLLSCIDCNRARTHEFEDQDPEVAGKANLFPLEDENMWEPREGIEERERPLLINPCAENPDQ